MFGGAREWVESKRGRVSGALWGAVFAAVLLAGLTGGGDNAPPSLEVAPAAAAVPQDVTRAAADVVLALVPMGTATMFAHGAVTSEIATNGYSTEITCAPNISWNPDAGQGLVRCAAGYTANNVESESTTAVYFVWRTDGAGGKTTRANYTTRGLKRCVGCTHGAAYGGQVTGSHRDLFCIASGSTDAGVVVAVECGK